MSNYDDDVLGVGNPEHPANRHEQKPFESDNLQECLDYAKLANEFESLENAIYNNEVVIMSAIQDLNFCIDCMSATDNVFVLNKLKRIKSNLIKTL